VTTSTYGLGRSFNEELMVAMAAPGRQPLLRDTARPDGPVPAGARAAENLCLRELRLSASAPDGVEVQMVSQLPPVDAGGGCRIWPGVRGLGRAAAEGAAGALPPDGRLLSVLRVAVDGRSLEGEAVALERAAWRCRYFRLRRSTISRTTSSSRAGWSSWRQPMR